MVFLVAMILLSAFIVSCGGGQETTSSLGAATTIVLAETTTSSAATSSTTTTLAPTTTSEVAATTTSTAATTTTEAPTTTSTTMKPLKWVRYQDTNSHFKYSGTHIKVNGANASGGTYTELRKGAKLTIAFTGTQIRLLAIPFWTGGIAVVALDGKTTKVDLYADVDYPNDTSKVVWTSKVLTYGSHTLVISNTGLMNPVSDGAIDRIDAVDIKGTIGS
jgi:hypothetical protein